MMKYYTIHATTEMLGVTAQTLRNWDRSGKLKPHHASPNGYRYYSEDSLNQVLNKPIEKTAKVIIIAEHDIENTAEPENLYKQFKTFYDRLVAEYGRVHYAFADYGGLGSLLTNGLNTYCMKNRIPLKIEDCSKGRIIDRIQLTCQLMAQGRLFVHKNCKYMRQAFLEAVWDEKKEDEHLDDYSFDNDSLDAFEYSIYNFADNLIKIGRY